MIIYQAKNKINGKLYVGMTIQGLEVRKEAHEYNVSKNKLECPIFYNAIKKYGKDGFEWSAIDEAPTQAELCIKEIYWISELNTIYPNGYNMAAGGNSPPNLTLNPRKVEICKKISNSLKGRTYEDIHGKEKADQLKKERSKALEGKKKSSSARENMSKAHTGLKDSEETKKRKSIAATGKEVTQEFRNKMSELGKINGFSAKARENALKTIKSEQYSKECSARMKMRKLNKELNNIPLNAKTVILGDDKAIVRAE